MKITLKLEGKTKEFYADITARKCREAYRIKKKLQDELKANEYEYTDEMMDELVEFVVTAFDKQFSADDFLDGYTGAIFESVEIINAIIDGLKEALNEGFPKNASAPVKPGKEAAAKR